LFATAAGEVAFERKGDGRQYVSVRSIGISE
jgi:ribosomal protein L27